MNILSSFCLSLCPESKERSFFNKLTMQKLVKKEYQIPFILVTSLFFLWGFAHAILDVLNKHFQDVMNISRAHSAWVQVMFYLGYFVMAIPAGLFINKSLRGLGNHTKCASSYLMMSPIGGAVGPLLMGYVADQSSMSFSFIIPLLSFIVVMMYAWKTLK